MKANIVFAFALVALSPACVKSEVADSSGSGFTVKLAFNIQAAPDDVYRKLIRVGEERHRSPLPAA